MKVGVNLILFVVVRYSSCTRYRTEFCLEERIVEDLLTNFSQAWLDQKEVSQEEVDDFLVGTFQDFFDADIFDTSVNLSKVLIRLYEECKSGQDKGVKHILGESFNKYISSPCSLVNSDNINNMEAIEAGITSLQVDIISNRMKSNVSNKSIELAVDNKDGWTTVVNKKSNRPPKTS